MSQSLISFGTLVHEWSYLIAAVDALQHSDEKRSLALSVLFNIIFRRVSPTEIFKEFAHVKSAQIFLTSEVFFKSQQQVGVIPSTVWTLEDQIQHVKDSGALFLRAFTIQ